MEWWKILLTTFGAIGVCLAFYEFGFRRRSVKKKGAVTIIQCKEHREEVGKRFEKGDRQFKLIEIMLSKHLTPDELRDARQDYDTWDFNHH